jgi:hypothetical protein
MCTDDRTHKEMGKELFEPEEKKLQEYSSPLKNSLLFRSTPQKLKNSCSPNGEYMFRSGYRMESFLVKELQEYSLLLENSLLSIQVNLCVWFRLGWSLLW